MFWRNKETLLKILAWITTKHFANHARVFWEIGCILPSITDWLVSINFHTKQKSISNALWKLFDFQICLCLNCITKQSYCKIYCTRINVDLMFTERDYSAKLYQEGQLYFHFIPFRNRRLKWDFLHQLNLSKHNQTLSRSWKWVLFEGTDKSTILWWSCIQQHQIIKHFLGVILEWCCLGMQNEWKPIIAWNFKKNTFRKGANSGKHTGTVLWTLLKTICYAASIAG